MSFNYLRKTLISLSRKNEPSKLTIPSTAPLFSLFSSSFSTLVTPTEDPSSELKDYLITQHKFSFETALKASSFVSRLKRSGKDAALALDFFRKAGFSEARLEELVLCDPRVLTADFNKCVKLKYKKVEELGFSESELAVLLCNVPGVVTLPRSAEHIALSISVLQSILCSNSDVIRLLRICNWFLCSDLRHIMLPNIELMEERGISRIQIRQMLFTFPRFFLIKPEFMKDCIRKVDEMGLSKDSKMYIHGIRVISSMSPENWEAKLNLFRNMGLSQADIRSLFRRIPHVFAVSEKKIKEVSKLLLSSEGVDIPYLVQHGELLVYSPAKRIKPRLEIVNALLSKGLLENTPKMTTVCKLETDKFIARFVRPYASELGEVGEKFLLSQDL